MAFPASSSSGNLKLSFKIALVSTGVLSLAALLKVWVPLVTDFAVSELPVMYTSVLSWLRPPYHYLVINSIIMSIVASSKLPLQQKRHQEYSSSPQSVPLVVVAAAGKASGDDAPGDYVINGGGLVGEEEMMMTDGGDKLVVSSGSVQQAPHRSDSMEMEVLIEKMEKKEREKPLASARFGHRKYVKASPEGGTAAATTTPSGVSKAKRHDTLENTWKTIKEGRPMTLTRHLKKSDIWDSQVRSDMANATPPPATKMKKSETFSGKQQPSQRSWKVIRREPSLSQDELRHL